MKFQKIMFCSLVALSLFQGCKKDDKSEEAPAAICKVATVNYVGGTGEIYSYDNKGRISKITSKDDTSNYQTYVYGLNTVQIGSEEYTLNSKGNVTSVSFSVPGFPQGGYTMTYSYDVQDHVIQTEFFSASWNSTTTFTWVDGNLSSSSDVAHDGSGDVTLTEYTYFTDKNNALAVTERLLGFSGTQNKNLVRSEKVTINGSRSPKITSYSYEYGVDGKLSKQIYSGISGSGSKSYQWNCN
jgi:hypothetical protein